MAKWPFQPNQTFGKSNEEWRVFQMWVGQRNRRARASMWQVKRGAAGSTARYVRWAISHTHCLGGQCLKPIRWAIYHTHWVGNTYIAIGRQYTLCEVGNISNLFGGQCLKPIGWAIPTKVGNICTMWGGQCFFPYANIELPWRPLKKKCVQSNRHLVTRIFHHF